MELFSSDIWLLNIYAQFGFAVSVSHILIYWEYKIIKQHLLLVGW